MCEYVALKIGVVNSSVIKLWSCFYPLRSTYNVWSQMFVGRKKNISSDKIRGICFSVIEQISEAKLSLLMGSCVKDVSPGGQS